MGRVYTRIYRLLQLISNIHSRRGLNPKKLAELCEVHERTIFRDIETLNASGVPCAFDAETNGYVIPGGFFMPPLELTFEEAMAMLAVVEEIAGERQLPFMNIAARAAEKIRSQLPSPILEAMEPLDDRVKVDLPPTMADESCRDVYDHVRDAICSRRMLRCIYDSLNSRDGDESTDEEFEFWPFALWFCQRAWYAVGHHGGRNEIRRLKLNRFVSVQSTDRPYRIPDDFDPREDLGLAWRMMRGPQRHRVAVRFEPNFADNASETRWHSTQEEEWDHEAGTVTLHFNVDGLDEIVWWVLGYGPGATVLEPKELAERVRDLAKATAERYGQ